MLYQYFSLWPNYGGDPISSEITIVNTLYLCRLGLGLRLGNISYMDMLLVKAETIKAEVFLHDTEVLVRHRSSWKSVIYNEQCKEATTSTI